MAIFLHFSENVYYNTLSSIFQGLFSILALSGIFIIFRIDQLSRDEAKYEEYIMWFLRKLPSYSECLNEIVKDDEYKKITDSLEGRNIDQYKEILEEIKSRFGDNRGKYEKEENRKKLSILAF